MPVVITVTLHKPELQSTTVSLLAALAADSVTGVGSFESFLSSKCISSLFSCISFEEIHSTGCGDPSL